ncbi:hypothetical protein DXG03_009168 [Asterophora parasitica]|uniref:RlpA-like protein double-psi beta-barrel domain-containing protein n=1 Tax=Asterophora parasitica TaxID=117018 RepID=A0A9P7G5R5_9AGAR|nr:hypothetical protein DXG03_009168 [Asterophora parasitica]
MVKLYTSTAALLVVLVSAPLPAITAIHNATSVRATHSRYSRAHSLGDAYQFDPRDGWQSINVSDLSYKYRRDEEASSSTDTQHLEPRSPKSNLGLGDTLDEVGKAVGGTFSKIWKGLKAIGKPKTVKITWYTGYDLKNPSCWAQGKWAPTDKSFACATTLNGWTDRPKCFKFLELCNTPKKCVFVRVVDSCAGCKPGSAHVDLTKAAFRQLAALDQGTLNVQLRAATEPEQWYEDLWGPKHKKQ